MKLFRALSLFILSLSASRQPFTAKAKLATSWGGESATRILSDIEAEGSTPSTRTLTTKHDERLLAESCPYKNSKWINYFVCQKGRSIIELGTAIIAQKVTSALSILGSSYIIQDVLRDPRKRDESTYHRIMLCLSCSDLMFSFFGPFLGSWVMPRGIQMFAVGNNFSCSFTGFFNVMTATSTPLYNCSLATFYMLKLKFSWVNSRVKAVEKWLLLLPCTVGLIVAIPSTATLGLMAHQYFCS